MPKFYQRSQSVVDRNGSTSAEIVGHHQQQPPEWPGPPVPVRSERRGAFRRRVTTFISSISFSFLFFLFHLIYEEDEIFKSLATCLTFEMWGVGYFLGVPAEIVNTEKTTVTTTGRILILLVSVDGGGNWVRISSQQRRSESL